MARIVHTVTFAAFIFISLVISRSALALQLPSPLVESDWLQQHLGQVTILDVREDIDTPADYQAWQQRVAPVT